MRRSAATAGLLLLLLGVFLISQGAQVVPPLAESLGLASRIKIQSALIPPTLLTVPPFNRTWISTYLDSNAQVAGSFHVGAGREIDFYVMNEESFHEWQAGRPTTVILGIFSTSLHNFTLNLTSEGTYYFVFDSQESTRGTVIFTLNIVRESVVINPAVEYLPFALTIVGILLFVWAIRSGGKRPEPPKAPVAASWKCRFCETENPLDKNFCGNCGRSRQ